MRLSDGGNGAGDPDERPVVLVVDRLGAFHAFADDVLSPEGFRVLRAETSDEALRLMDRRGVGPVLVDVCVPDRGLLENAGEVIRAGVGIPTVVVTGCPLMDAAARVLYPEASGFLMRPCSPEELRERVEGASGKPRTSASPGEPFHGIVGVSAGIRRVVEQIHEVAPTDSTVLITGETGTGKELVARAIHTCSSRSDGPYVVVDTLALPETLAESELFGHERGAFTGAVDSKAGLFEAADGGTIFLDEIGDVSGKIQGRLLRAIQEREVRRVGSLEARKVDVRIIAATQHPLARALEEGRLRPDLYYRLSVCNIAIPPLRERMEDVPVLVEHFLRSRTGEVSRIRGCTDLARQILQSYDWPGNVRELLAVIESALIGAEGDRLGALDLPERLRVLWREESLPREGGEPPPRAIRAALEETDGHRADAADLLGVSRTTLWRWMKRHAI